MHFLSDKVGVEFSTNSLGGVGHSGMRVPGSTDLFQQGVQLTKSCIRRTMEAPFATLVNLFSALQRFLEKAQ